MNKQTLRSVVFVGLFLVPFVPFLVYSSFFFPFITTKVFAWRIIIEIVFAAWVVLAIWDQQYRPKKSVILYSILAFLAVIGLADIFGVDRASSFWSNFERMEGYISLLHLGAFFLVIGSIFEERHWKRWWNVSLVASAIMACYAILQLWGVLRPSQDMVRVDGTFGNAIYLAVYMLIHVFVALFFMAREWKNKNMRWVYGLLILFQIIIIYYTATRGAILGLLGGLLVMALINLKNREDHSIRKLSVAVLVGLVVIVGGFFLARNTEFVAKNPVLSRFSSLTLSEIKTQGRYFVWPIALEGFKERPILGWGQENFSYVFQKFYQPEMYHLEPWFDRAHNIFLDWMVVGGLLGILSYLALYVTFLLVVWKKENKFSFAEKSILTGLISAYFFHNFFVFDHLTSYVLFFSLLAYLHFHSASEILWTRNISVSKITKIVVPIGVIAMASVLYFINIQPLMGNVYTIEALKSVQLNQPSRAVSYFQKAYGASPLGRSEVVQHMTTNAVPILESELTLEEKNVFHSFAKEVVVKEATDSWDDAKTQLMAGSFLSTVGNFEEALKHLNRAKELMPGKQQTYLELANIYVYQNKKDEAIKILQYVAEISPDHKTQMEEYIRQIRAGEI